MKISITINWRLVLILAGTVSAIAFIIYAVIRLSSITPVPADIKQQINFSVPYPQDPSYNLDGWKYQVDQKTLTFTTKSNGSLITFTEQKTPVDFADDPAAYNRFIGGLRPYSNFKSPLGTVSLTTFVVAGTFEQTGQTAILNSHGTLLLAHSEKNLTTDDWHALFQSFQVSD